MDGTAGLKSKLATPQSDSLMDLAGLIHTLVPLSQKRGIPWDTVKYKTQIVIHELKSHKCAIIPLL